MTDVDDALCWTDLMDGKLCSHAAELHTVPSLDAAAPTFAAPSSGSASTQTTHHPPRVRLSQGCAGAILKDGTRLVVPLGHLLQVLECDGGANAHLATIAAHRATTHVRVRGVG